MEPVEHLRRGPAEAIGVEVTFVDETGGNAGLPLGQAGINIVVERTIGGVERMDALEPLCVGADKSLRLGNGVGQVLSRHGAHQ
ncbi:hypothetical protein D3C87_2020600 [compost metagenome]